MDQIKTLTLSPSPHVKHKNTTQVVMRDVLIALTPAFIWSIVIYGWMAAVLTVLTTMRVEAMSERTSSKVGENSTPQA